ncbi:hypothetical protein NHH82_26625 [Oxalobacteraceae bacterium OTU3REALA1]|nr:hypothetical protein NHH82_26625 [Oxalobacteraceae bacterium OTU3REALA1]
MSKFVIAIALLFASSLSYACGDNDDPMRLPQLAMVKTSSQGNLSLYSAQIRSLAQLKAHLSLYGNASPLASLSPTGRQEFIDRLTFNENGLTGYRYSILEKELTPSQIYSILSLFGTQNHTSMFKKAKVASQADAQLLDGGASANAVPCPPATPGKGPAGPGTGPGAGGGGGGGGTGIPHGNDYPDMACKAKSTCSRSYSDICMASC